MSCQAPLSAVSGGYQPMQSVNQGASAAVGDWKSMGADKKIVAGICGILLGGFGVHKFVLGYTTEGIIQIVITFVTCGMGSVVGLVEGIIYLTKSDEDFVRTYIQNKKGWF
jgi:TM2 domain-containing membrane protein YozV